MPTQIHRKIAQMPTVKQKAKGLIGNGGDFPTLKQIQDYQKNCPDRLASKNVSASDFRCLLESHHAVPDDLDEPFVLEYKVDSSDDFDYVVTTKRLLEKFSLTDRRNIDMTYKHSKSGFPIMVMGVDDANRRHHRAMLGVSAKQRCE